MPSCILHTYNSGIVAVTVYEYWINHSAQLFVFVCGSCMRVIRLALKLLSLRFFSHHAGTAAGGDDDNETPVTYESTL